MHFHDVFFCIVNTVHYPTKSFFLIQF